MTRTPIATAAAPAAIGPYSQAIRTGDTVYLSGQIPLDPGSMTLVSEDFSTQTRQVFENLKAVCEAAGGNLGRVVKLTAYLTDLSRFTDFNGVMSEYFQEPYPARAAVQVSALPKGAQVEVEGIMVL